MNTKLKKIVVLGLAVAILSLTANIYADTKSDLEAELARQLRVAQRYEAVITRYQSIMARLPYFWRTYVLRLIENYRKRLVLITARITEIRRLLAEIERAEQEGEQPSWLERGNMLALVREMVDDLGLTADQLSQIQALRQNNTRGQGIRDLRAIRRDLAAALREVVPDTATINRLTDELKEFQAESISRRIRNALALREILTSAQLEEFRIFIEARRGNRGNN